jgi:NAD+ synthase (glutamine-hydrolysing)
MDGDSSGGLSPLGGVDKAYLRVWLSWLEKEGPRELSHYPSLKAVNVQAPTAELRPSKEKQTDEKDLMPYEVLDTVERYAIRDKLLPTDVLGLVTERYGRRYSVQDLTSWVTRFFKLWSVNQWKRFPILSGGYAEELSALTRGKGKKR